MIYTPSTVYFVPGDHDVNEMMFGPCTLGAKCATCKTRMQQAYRKWVTGK